MREWAEQEIIIPSGPFEGLAFRVDRQPFSGHWFDAVDSGRYSECVITGPSQSGKTLIGFVIPLLYHLFEVGETVIGATPDFDIARDKWEQDIEPVLGRTRYRDLLPGMGSGSKGGKTTSVKFKNGAILRWMTAGGSDKSRAAFTSRVVCMTETDGFDSRTSTSTEADKIKQIEARMRSYTRERRRIYKECTLTTDKGHTWQRLKEGTCSMLLLPCPHCGQFVAPERENLGGWQHATSDEEARDKAQFFCPECGAAWSEEERRKANANCLLVHRGQEVRDGVVVGEEPRTRTLGFRWSAVNNMLVPAGDIGVDEWSATRAIDEDSAERELCQFVWSIPYVPKGQDTILLDTDQLSRRQDTSLGRGQVPNDAEYITVGIDVNKRVLHWTAIAWRRSHRGHVIDYGTQGVLADAHGFDKAIVVAMQRLRDKLGTGWTANKIERIVVDCRWQPDEVKRAIKSLKDRRFRAFAGLGLGHWSGKTFSQPRKQNRDVVWIGDRAYEQIDRVHGCLQLYADANHWKTWLHSRLLIEEGDGEYPEGAITLFASTDANEHLNFAKHITAEREIQSFEPGKGYQRIWEPIRAQNHWLDSTYMACVAAHRCGFQSVAFRKQPNGPRLPQQQHHAEEMPINSATFYGGAFNAATFS